MGIDTDLLTVDHVTSLGMSAVKTKNWASSCSAPSGNVDKWEIKPQLPDPSDLVMEISANSTQMSNKFLPASN